MTQKDYYTWEQFDFDIRKMVKWAKCIRLTQIYGVHRGGLILAVVLAHHLNLPLIYDIHEIDSTTLIVDDIVDSGGTMRGLKELLTDLNIGGYQIATLHYNMPKTRIKETARPNFYARPKYEWVVYPWETEASSKYDNTI
jgi:hypoxanthine phosphoribosyltransferase